MKRFLITAFAIAFATASPALAAHRPHSTASAHASVRARTHPSGHAGPAHRSVAHVRVTTHRAHATRPTRRSSVYRTTHHRQATERQSHHPVRHGSHRHSSHHTAGRVPRHAVHHAVRHEIRQVGHAAKGPFAKVRKVVHAKRRFHAGTYRSPPGWFARHWVMGERLPRPWFVRDYWIMDWQVYGLWAPVDGLIWVRVGSDALLIDPDTGEIIGIEYDVFW